MLVIDASILVVALADDGEHGDLVRGRLRGETLYAPDLIDLEVLSVLRRQNRNALVDDRRALMAVTDLAEIPVRRAKHTPLIHRCWELRHHLTAYDAAYVALAEALDTTLLTADSRIADATGVTCAVEVLRP